MKPYRHRSVTAKLHWKQIVLYLDTVRPAVWCTRQRSRRDPADAANLRTEYYTGLTENQIKKRIKKHFSDIEKYNRNDPDNHKSGTRLSRYCGELRTDGIPYNIKWGILAETGIAFNPTTSFCKLCTTEKYMIMFNPGEATLNLRSEFFGHCRHKERHLLRK